MRWPGVADRFGGQDQPPPDCGGVTPERVQRGVLVVPVFQAGKGWLVDPTTPGHLGQCEPRRLAGAPDLVHERAKLAMLAVEADPRGTNVFLADDIPDSRQPGYDGLKEDLP